MILHLFGCIKKVPNRRMSFDLRDIAFSYILYNTSKLHPHFLAYHPGSIGEMGRGFQLLSAVHCKLQFSAIYIMRITSQQESQLQALLHILNELLSYGSHVTKNLSQQLHMLRNS